MTMTDFVARTRAAGHDLPDGAFSGGALIPCAKCGVKWPAGLIDAKHSKGGNYERLECPECYGPGWSCM